MKKYKKINNFDCKVLRVKANSFRRKEGNLRKKKIRVSIFDIIFFFREYPNKIFEYGFLIHPSEDKDIIQRKFNELLNFKINNDM